MSESTTTTPTTVRWGIMGPGGIARTFARNLLQQAPNQSNRPKDIIHHITAVASSTSRTTAQSFITTNITPHQPASTPCTAHGTYLSLAQSSEVDIIYIATPHSNHFRTAMLALSHRKPVLCEKPLCVNARQAGKLVDMARKNGVFLMEALWTRFLPIAGFVQDVVRSGRIGEVVRVTADFSMSCGDEEGVREMFGFGAESRMVNPKLAGGVLLDLGIYSLSWIFLSVYHLLPPTLQTQPTLIGATMTPYPPSTTPTSSTPHPNLSEQSPWVDASTTLLLTLPSAPNGTGLCHAVATTSLYSNTDPGYGGDDPTNPLRHRYSTPSARIQGTSGEIQIFGPLPRPQRCRVFTRVPKGQGDGGDVVAGNTVASPSGGGFSVEEKIFESKGDGTGMFWEADEVARCLRDGRLQSAVIPWDETLQVLRVMDDVRKMCGLDFGDEVEGVEWQSE